MKRVAVLLTLCLVVVVLLTAGAEAAPSIWNGSYKMYSSTSSNGLNCYLEVKNGKVRITMPDSHVIYGYMDTETRMIIPEWGNAEGTRDRGSGTVQNITWASGHPSMKGHVWYRVTID